MAMSSTFVADIFIELETLAPISTIIPQGSVTHSDVDDAAVIGEMIVKQRL